MTRCLALLAALMATVALNANPVPPKPNFSGSWNLEGPESQKIVGRNGKSVTITTPYGTAFELKQDAKQAAIKNDQGATLSLALFDGTAVSDIHDGFDYRTTASWVGQKLVIAVQTRAGQSTRTLFFDEQKNLVVEVGAPPGAAKAKFVYKKKTSSFSTH